MRKKIHTWTRRHGGKFGTFRFALFDTISLLVWTIPHPRLIQFWIDRQIPCFLKYLPKAWMTERRVMQRTFGRSYHREIQGIYRCLVRLSSRADSLLYANIDWKVKP